MAGSEFLDKQGLVVLWDRIKELVYECCCGHKDYECINDEVITSECFEKAVLSVTGGKGGDCGFSCENQRSEIFSAEFTTAQGKSDPAPISDAITLSTSLDSAPSKIWVIWDNIYDYDELEPCAVNSGTYFYGAEPDFDTFQFDFSTYPYCIVMGVYDGSIYLRIVTEMVGDYYATIEAEMTTASVNSCFKTAVNTAIDRRHYIPVYGDTKVSGNLYSTMSFADMRELYASGSLVGIKYKRQEDDFSANFYPLEYVEFSNSGYDPNTKASHPYDQLKFARTTVDYDQDYVYTERWTIDLGLETINLEFYRYPEADSDV